MNDEFYREIAGKFIFTVKKDLLYTENEVWVQIKDGQAQIGVTDFLQRRGGDAVFVELPNKGSGTQRLDEIGSYETIKAVISIPSPFSGVISDINTLLNDKPELINDDPYGEGWLVILSPSNLEEDKQYLLSAEEYFDLMKLKIQDKLKSGKEV